MIIPISARYFSEGISIKAMKGAFSEQLLSESSTDLFYKLVTFPDSYTTDDRYVLIFNYGVVVFANVPEKERQQIVKSIIPHSQNLVEASFEDTFQLRIAPEREMKFTFESLIVPQFSETALKVVMLNMAQSVALDYYSHTIEKLLSQIKSFTNEMARYGRIHIRKRNMLRFLGKTLTIKNSIIENLYVFDSPDIVWEDEYLDKINQGLRKNFDLRVRFKELEYTFRVVEDNLSTFRELYLHGVSSMLEWFIIILILIDVIGIFLFKA